MQARYNTTYYYYYYFDLVLEKGGIFKFKSVCVCVCTRFTSFKVIIICERIVCNKNESLIVRIIIIRIFVEKFLLDSERSYIWFYNDVYSLNFFFLYCCVWIFNWKAGTNVWREDVWGGLGPLTSDVLVKKASSLTIPSVRYAGTLKLLSNSNRYNLEFCWK